LATWLVRKDPERRLQGHLRNARLNVALNGLIGTAQLVLGMGPLALIPFVVCGLHARSWRRATRDKEGWLARDAALRDVVASYRREAAVGS
jgi:hypothetical protein